MKKKFLRQVMSPREIDLALSRIAAEILEHHPNLDDVVIVGIRRRGVPLAEIIRKKIEKLSGQDKYRLRQGNYRVLYSIDDAALTVVIVKVGHRRELYR